MKKDKITANGGYYYDNIINDTVHFSVSKLDNNQCYGYPKEGVNISIDTADSLGERETGLDGNTNYIHNGCGWKKREKNLTIIELIREILNKH